MDKVLLLELVRLGAVQPAAEASPLPPLSAPGPGDRAAARWWGGSGKAACSLSCSQLLAAGLTADGRCAFWAAEAFPSANGLVSYQPVNSCPTVNWALQIN